MPHVPIKVFGVSAANDSTRIRTMNTKYLALFWSALLLAACGAPREAPQARLTMQEPLPAELAGRSEAFAGRSVNELEADAPAMALALELFDARCASCHDDNPEARGAADLARGRYNFGASEESIRTTIRDGRSVTMPALGNRLGETSLGQLVAYVQSMGSQKALSSFEEGGQELFAANCAVCHGAAGEGNIELGAPNLADGYWQNGRSMMNIRLAITRGIDGQCPAQGEALSATDIDLLTAFVRSLIEHNGSN
jgi:cytochrome c oxidase cbb3-type subunit III